MASAFIFYFIFFFSLSLEASQLYSLYNGAQNDSLATMRLALPSGVAPGTMLALEMGGQPRLKEPLSTSRVP